MSEILSQNQIDVLLSELMGAPTGQPHPLEDDTIKIYNFKTPKKLSREQQRVLSGVYEVFARHFAAYLAGLTRSYCEISVASVEEHPYFEYNNALPDILMTAILDINVLKGAVLLDMTDSATFALVQRMLGGNLEEKTPPSRDYTDIELALMDRVFRKAAVYMEDAWAHTPEVSVVLRQLETNTRFIKSVAMDETVAVIVMNIKIGPVKGIMTCCVPCMGAGEALDAFNADWPGKDTKDEQEEEISRQTILTGVNEANVEVCGILGSTTITMREALSLQPGDVIKLNQHLNTPATLTVNGRRWLSGRPGISRNQIAVKIGKP